MSGYTVHFKDYQSAYGVWTACGILVEADSASGVTTIAASVNCGRRKRSDFFKKHVAGIELDKRRATLTKEPKG